MLEEDLEEPIFVEQAALQPDREDEEPNRVACCVSSSTSRTVGREESRFCPTRRFSEAVQRGRAGGQRSSADLRTDQARGPQARAPLEQRSVNGMSPELREEVACKRR
ncbi:hypothetical protein THAOC_23007 [Thalassiosira oceanica]|uniref:Uncharacterized protein n=1 Tax=Thalassiosira oceanica TaxID=159749 RepID=K0SEC7_THAOC|nr:hypothetical protein THAOC_23007 [Thalassiosira oceanica]|eukprot:EJK56997.1 hypothetical protein THAOC_23007 [Thalassiosira oceanica]